MDKYMYWLDNVPKLGKKAKIRLLEAFGTPYEVFASKEHYLKFVLDEKKLEVLKAGKVNWDVDGRFEELQNKGIRMTTVIDDNFPQKLRNIPDTPFSLYYKGKLPMDELPSVAVIGARECSEYGKYIAQELGKELGNHQIQVISGMARGIDGISQYAALESGSCSYGIMGCGVDICYPSGNRRLYDRLILQGGILSTYPPGTQPLPQLFPPRNRIVSGLADVLVIIEARQKSGTAITVEMALEQGKDIYAVPGRITDRLSDGCNKMLSEGAHVFLSPRDFIQELFQLIPDKMEYAAGKGELWKGADEASTEKSEEEATATGILTVLDFYPMYIDDIAEKITETGGCGISVSELNVMLMELCLSGRIKQESPGWFSKIGS